MKKLLAFILTIFVFASTISVPAHAATPADSGEEISNPQIVHSYSKTATCYYPKSVYPNLNDIPQTIPYCEYNDRLYSWFSGTLTVCSVISNGSSWVVTYSGSLVGRI